MIYKKLKFTSAFIGPSQTNITFPNICLETSKSEREPIRSFFRMTYNILKLCVYWAFDRGRSQIIAWGYDIILTIDSKI